MTRHAGALILVLLALCGVAQAADLPPYGTVEQPLAPLAPAFLGWEIRAGALVHDAYSPEKGSVDLNGELLLPKWWHVSNGFWDQFIPHPDIGFTANFAGKTSNVYGGAAWNFDITDRIFLSADFGLGINNGKVGRVVPPGHNPVGCHWWFHESGSLGYRLTESWSIMATIEHSSNAGLCVENRGLTNYGLRVGYRF